MAEGGVPDVAVQRENVAALLKTPMKKGDTWYLVDTHWFKQWKKYVGFDSWDKCHMGDPNFRPGPVDNAGLLRALDLDGDVLTIKEHLIDELDYILVPAEGWRKLVSWYGLTDGQEPIGRKVVQQGMFVKYCKVEVYLMELNLCESSNMDNLVTRHFSKADTIKMIEEEMRKLFSIPDHTEIRLWVKYMKNNFEPLNNPDSTVEGAGLFQGQVVMMKQKNDNDTWSQGPTAPNYPKSRHNDEKRNLQKQPPPQRQNVAKKIRTVTVRKPQTSPRSPQSPSLMKTICPHPLKKSEDSGTPPSSTTHLQSQSSIMSAANSLLSEDQFLCSICLEVFTDPVSTPCGHNFCKTCINKHWNISDSCWCPVCKKEFKTRPQLEINTLFSEMISQFRREAPQQSSSSCSKQQATKSGEVPCDICTGTKLKALKSCLVCLLSYCENHLEPHLTMKGLKRHQLMEPVENLEGRMCMNHDKPLELFCETDQTCVCMICSVLDHKTHEFVPLREGCEGKKAELGKTEAELQQMIQNRRLKIEEIKESLKMSKDAADREKAEGIQVFTALKESVERGLKQLIKEIEEAQETREKQAEDFIKDLEQEISELMGRSSEVEQLLKSEDHLHVLQSFSSLKAAPPTKDWTKVRVHPPSYEGTVVRAVDQLEKTLRNQMKK